MSLLEDLKRQAESKKLDSNSGQAQLHPVHQALYGASTYFGELANSLNILKPDVRRQFYIEGSTRLTNLKQCEYIVRDRRKTVGHTDCLLEVSLRFSCVGDQNLKFERDSDSRIQRMKEFFWGYSLPFEMHEIWRERGGVERVIFTLISNVPSSVTLAGDWDTGKFSLILRNIELLGNIEQDLDISEINHDLFEEIGKLVLAQPNRLKEFGKSRQPMSMSIIPPSGQQ